MYCTDILSVSSVHLLVNYVTHFQDGKFDCVTRVSVDFRDEMFSVVSFNFTGQIALKRHLIFSRGCKVMRVYIFSLDKLSHG